MKKDVVSLIRTLIILFICMPVFVLALAVNALIGD